MFFWVFPPRQDRFLVWSRYVFIIIIIASKNAIQYTDLSGVNAY